MDVLMFDLYIEMISCWIEEKLGIKGIDFVV